MLSTEVAHCEIDLFSVLICCAVLCRVLLVLPSAGIPLISTSRNDVTMQATQAALASDDIACFT